MLSTFESEAALTAIVTGASSGLGRHVARARVPEIWFDVLA
jgi:NAD(P)-dependent dehydrogenase (short-subunit alcohol dehydrogenase family)